MHSSAHGCFSCKPTTEESSRLDVLLREILGIEDGEDRPVHKGGGGWGGAYTLALPFELDPGILKASLWENH